ncbi:MAG: hypothetical protein WBW27_26000 [Pseudolabrys sp.]
MLPMTLAALVSAFFGPPGVVPQKGCGVMATASGDHVYGYATVQQQRFVRAPEIV